MESSWSSRTPRTGTSRPPDIHRSVPLRPAFLFVMLGAEICAMTSVDKFVRRQQSTTATVSVAQPLPCSEENRRVAVSFAPRPGYNPRPEPGASQKCSLYFRFPEFSNRQHPRLEMPATRWKQTTATRSNRQSKAFLTAGRKPLSRGVLGGRRCSSGKSMVARRTDLARRASQCGPILTSAAAQRTGEARRCSDRRRRRNTFRWHARKRDGSPAK